MWEPSMIGESSEPDPGLRAIRLPAKSIEGEKPDSTSSPAIQSSASIFASLNATRSIPPAALAPKLASLFIR